MVDDNNAAALLVALLDLVRNGTADLTDADTSDIEELTTALQEVVAERISVP